MKKSYSRREADEILRRAIAFETPDGISHQDLVAAAREVGIPADAIDRAVEQVATQGALAARIDAIRRRRRRAFFRHALVYALVNSGVVAIDWLNGGPWFFYWLLILWTVVLAVFAVFQLAPDPERLARRAERELEKQRRKEERRARRLARKQGRPTDHAAVEAAFDEAVKEGVSTLLTAATRVMRGASSAANRYRVEGSQEEDDARGEQSGSQRARYRS